MTAGEPSPEEAGTAFAADSQADSAAPSVPDPPPPPRHAGLLAWAMVLATTALLAAADWVAFSPDRAGTRSFWEFAVGPTVLLAVLALVRAWRDGDLRAYVAPAWGDATWGVVSAAVLLGASTLAVHVLAPAGTPREGWLARIYLELGDPSALRQHSSMVAVLLCVAAAAEEIVWRGMVTGLIAERVGSRSAWVWTAFPYALAHVPTLWRLADPEAGKNPLVVLGAFVLGLVWGAIARSTRRLFPSILSHAAFDWCVVMVFRLWGPGV